MPRPIIIAVPSSGKHNIVGMAVLTNLYIVHMQHRGNDMSYPLRVHTTAQIPAKAVPKDAERNVWQLEEQVHLANTEIVSLKVRC